MGARLVIDVSVPFQASPRQRDLVHAKCTTHVARRLERAGWTVATEIEIGDQQSRGWIDVLGWHPDTGMLLVIEVKTELRDLGAIERQLNWYEREAWAAARRLGWRPRRAVGCLLLLSTEAVEERIRDNREALARSFPARASEIATVVTRGAAGMDRPRRGFALIDPRSRRISWLRLSRQAPGSRFAGPTTLGWVKSDQPD